MSRNKKPRRVKLSRAGLPLKLSAKGAGPHGKRLLKLRRRESLTQTELGDLLGLSKGRISQVETSPQELQGPALILLELYESRELVIGTN